MFSADLIEAFQDPTDLDQDIPIPEGMKINRPTERRQLQLELSPSFGSRRRRVWG